MSTRNLRKIYYGGNTLPPPEEDNSDAEYEPAYVKKAPANLYAGLELSSHSESEKDAQSEENETGQAPVVQQKKKKKKQKKGGQAKKSTAATNEELGDLDEIDKSVREVNALLGSPPPPSTSKEKPPPDPADLIMGTTQKHLNVTNELNRLFGPIEEEQQGKRRGREHNLARLLKKTIVPVKDFSSYQKQGLSMSLLRREGDVAYFVFDHTKEYQRTHRVFLQLVSRTPATDLLPAEVYNSLPNNHIDSMLETADTLFRLEEYTTANSLVEKAIAYMQYVSCPSFNLTDRKTRLEYKYPENRPFLVALLKYVYLVSNRACHRTALELCKLLLNLEPRDPLGALLVVDALALRAREHAWLVRAVDLWAQERDARLLFNIQYSCACAHFHLAAGRTQELAHADELLQGAVLRYPSMALRLLECAGAADAALSSRALYATHAPQASENLKDLINMVAKFVCSKWREPSVLKWLQRNAVDIANKYDTDVTVQEEAQQLSKVRRSLFQTYPDEVIRHLSVIRPMSDLLFENGGVPAGARERAADPRPPKDSVDRYNYEQRETPQQGTFGDSFLMELFTSLLPSHGAPAPP